MEVDSNASEIDETDQVFDRAQSSRGNKKKFAVKVTRDDD